MGCLGFETNSRTYGTDCQLIPEGLFSDTEKLSILKVQLLSFFGRKYLVITV
jgi:hypothetical protein